MTRPNVSIVGRGAHTNPANRFDNVVCEDDFQQLTDDEFSTAAGPIVTEYIPDGSQSIVSSNNSPDLSFRYSLNPYRGCSHG